jgi:hypothetical protein
MLQHKAAFKKEAAGKKKKNNNNNNKYNLVGSIYGRSFIKIAHFVPIHSNFIFFDFLVRQCCFY